MERDFTYIDDLVEGIVRLVDAVPQVGHPVEGVADSLSPAAPFRVVNIGGGKPVKLMEFVRIIEDCLGRKATLNLLPMQAGDVRATEARADLIEKLTGFKPSISVEEGVRRFIAWHASYYGKA